MDPELIAKILGYALANGVSVELQTQALAGVVTYEQMVEQHEAQAAANKPLELLIYGVVGAPEDGLDAKTVRQQIVDTSGPIVMRINSGGGLVMEGLAIFNALSDAKAAGRTITVHIDGVAASMASILAMAGDEIIMADNGLMMIHNPWDVAMGDAQAIRKKADVLDKIRDQMVGIYAARTGLTADQLTPLMDATTWMTAQEALEAKFVTSISESSTAKAQIKPVDVTSFGFACVPTNPLIINTQADPSPSTAQASIVSKETDVDPKLIAEILAFAAANGVSPALQSKALLGEITIEEMKAQHAAAQAAVNTGVSAADVTRILASAKNLGIADEIRDQALTGAISFTQMMDKHNEALVAADMQANTSTIRTGRTLDASPQQEIELRVEAMAAVAVSEVGGQAQVSERAKQYMDGDLEDIGRAMIRARGQSPDRMKRREVLETITGAQGFISTGDLSNVLQPVVNGTFREGYQSMMDVVAFDEMASETIVNDFNEVKSVYANWFQGIGDMAEGEDFPLASLTDGAVSMKIATQGVEVKVTRETIINDQFNVIYRRANMLGRGFRQEEENKFHLILENNKIKTDSGVNTVFSQANKNLITIPALDPDNFKAVKLLLRNQVNADGNKLNFTPRKLIVSPDLEDEGIKLCTAVNATVTGDVNVNAKLGMKLVVMNGLPDGTFYLTDDKLADVITAVRRRGAVGAQIKSILDPKGLSVGWVGLNDFSFAFIDTVGAVKGKIGNGGN